MSTQSIIATVALIVHSLAAVIWVGGMFFALVVLRPATATLAAGPRLQLWLQVLGTFFRWVFAAIVLLLASGYTIVIGVDGGFGEIGLYVNLMQAIGILMMLLFFHVYFAPWRRFCAALERQDQGEAARQLAQIRALVAVNLTLGLITVAIGSSGRYWG
jgi:uncharacterized membrane protein